MFVGQPVSDLGEHLPLVDGISAAIQPKTHSEDDADATETWFTVLECVLQQVQEFFSFLFFVGFVFYVIKHTRTHTQAPFSGLVEDLAMPGFKTAVPCETTGVESIRW